MGQRLNGLSTAIRGQIPEDYSLLRCVMYGKVLGM